MGLEIYIARSRSQQLQMLNLKNFFEVRDRSQTTFVCEGGVEGGGGGSRSWTVPVKGMGREVLTYGTNWNVVGGRGKRGEKAKKGTLFAKRL